FRTCCEGLCAVDVAGSEPVPYAVAGHKRIEGAPSYVLRKSWRRALLRSLPTPRLRRPSQRIQYSHIAQTILQRDRHACTSQNRFGNLVELKPILIPPRNLDNPIPSHHTSRSIHRRIERDLHLNAAFRPEESHLLIRSPLERANERTL